MTAHQGRGAWTNRTVYPPRQDGPRQGTAVHWPGDEVLTIEGHDDCLRYLRGWESYHVDGRGWSALGYNQAACRHGYLIEGRGAHVQSGANGNTTANNRYGSVLAILGRGENPNPALLAAILAGAADQAPGGALVTHDYARRSVGLGGTECPGPALTAWVNAGATTTEGTDDDMPTPEEFWEHKITHLDKEAKNPKRPVRVIVAETHNRAKDARTNASNALAQANRNADALAALAERLAPDVAAEVVDLLGDRINVTISVDQADDVG